MRKLLNNLREVKEEMLNKVSWPTWPELTESAIVVSIASLIIAGVVLVIDLSFENLLKLVYGLF
ncbi:MAG: preprotein translocase subunit SecE [Bacteroidetes bacterium GWF2_43_63]|nr:MAG: preprotein translocase subunit SecE [Bacteroidetes bacterium GWE2_42_42]OFY55171.1 MAG: preprotein translocase subunit SecE [Bacteroidetes bacterium GWF2_43_63]HBG70206.1 preprotein translocase subunit SecE [Bacteroidales bacterium]HCB63121.1 preprotein translocase subunit SecE [Bacteroidales bacterium]HCY22660.1 preprotein translocase subunit SecE [Bacteroidales bacterium]